MSNDSLRRRRIDDAIDRAVHELVQIDPLPGLRFRVLARLDRPPRGGGSGWLRSLAFARGSWEPLSAIAIVSIAVMIFVPGFFRERAPEPSAAPSRHVAAAPAAAPIASTDSHPAPATAAAPSAAGRTSAPAARQRIAEGRVTEPTPESIFGPRTARVGAASLDAAGSAGEAAAAVEGADPEGALPLRPLAPLQPIAIAPIAIAPILVQPIGNEERLTTNKGNR